MSCIMRKTSFTKTKALISFATYKTIEVNYIVQVYKRNVYCQFIYNILHLNDFEFCNSDPLTASFRTYSLVLNSHYQNV